MGSVGREPFLQMQAGPTSRLSGSDVPIAVVAFLVLLLLMPQLRLAAQLVQRPLPPPS